MQSQSEKRFSYACAVAVLCGLALTTGVAQESTSVRALVLTDLGDASAVSAMMQSAGWAVTTSESLEIDTSNLSSQFDVVWIPAENNSGQLYSIVDGDLMVFALDGGVVVVTGVNGTALDVAPGGPDAFALPETGAGSVSIVTADHPSLTGSGIAGASITAADLDPTSSGGRASLRNAPEGAIVIAQNSQGPAAVEYPYGGGRVLVSSLLDPTPACTGNLVLYAGSLVP